MLEGNSRECEQLWILSNTLMVLRVHCNLRIFKTHRFSKEAPQHNWFFSMFHKRDNVLVFLCVIFASVNRELRRLAKRWQVCLTCAKDILPQELWPLNIQIQRLCPCPCTVPPTASLTFGNQWAGFCQVCAPSDQDFALSSVVLLHVKLSHSLT